MVVRSMWSDAEPTFEYAFDQERIVIGRHGGADVFIPHAAVSLHHATIGKDGSRYVATDQGSTNGTYVNGERLPPQRPKALRRGDIVDCGGFRIEFEGPVPIVAATSEYRTASLARRIVRETLASQHVAAPRLFVDSRPERNQQHEKDHQFVLPGPPARLTVGSGASVDLQLSDPSVSSHHLEIEADLDGYVVRARDGMTFLVGELRAEERRLRNGDVVVVGDSRLRFEDPAETMVQELVDRNDAHIDPPALAPRKVDDEESRSPPNASRPPTPPSEEVSPRSVPARPGMPGSDLVIYALAGTVLLVSVVALVMLLRS